MRGDTNSDVKQKNDGNFKEEASIVLKNKQLNNSSTTVTNTCPATKQNGISLNGNASTINGQSANNDAKTNGAPNDKLNGHSKITNGIDSKQNGQTVKVDTLKAQKKFSQELNEEGLCPLCNKLVYQVEKIKAEKRVYHKQCFRCKECRKQLSMDSYNSHKGQLYCQVHFKLLLRPKPVECIGDDFLSRRQLKMIIRESTPTETPKDVIRSDSKIDDGLDNIQLDLTNLRQRFENGNQSSEEISRPNSKAERNQLQRSESILAKVQRYQSLTSGEKMANSDGETSSTHNSDNESDLIKEDLNHKEKVNFNGLSAIKSQFENGSLNNCSLSDDGAQSAQSVTNGGRDDETKKELYKLRQRMCLGRSASMKQVYENQVKETTSSSKSNSSSNTSSIERPRIKTNSMKERFEKGEFTSENELEINDFKERLRKEVDEELTAVQEADTLAKEAKNKFKQLEKSNSFQQNSSQKTNSNLKLNNNNENSTTPRSTPTHHPKASAYSTAKKSDQPIEVVKCSEAGQKEEVHIDVNQLQERYRFFEQQLTNQNNQSDEKPVKPTETPRRPIQIPKAIDDCVVETPNDQIKRDPNIIRSSDVIDDLPKENVAKKMLNVFQQLEKSNSIINVTKELNGAPREKPPIRCITPPKDFTVDNDETDAPVNGNQDKDIVRSSYKDDSVIPVEPEIARNLKAKFENWASEGSKENRRNSNLSESNEEIPHNDITKSLRSKFEQIKDDKPEAKVNKPVKVNRFVQEGIQVAD